MSLARAEFLKLHRRRGLLAGSIALTIGPVLAAFAVLTILHSANPAKHAPAGGAENLAAMLNILTVLAGVTAILIGTTAGAADVGSGVFRDLVATGRSRTALFAARIPGGLAMLLPLVLGAYAVAALGSVLLAGSLPAPGPGTLVRFGAWIALVAMFSSVLALGVASLLDSRGTAIGILLGWQLAIAPVLVQIRGLGSLRAGVDAAALQRIEPDAVATAAAAVPMSGLAAVAVLVVWTGLALGAGVWRTATRDA
jgi:ABC-type transport system involved in multi-copper enzyme maturation permease subunit